MRIAIIDGVNQDIGLKILFPEADYFINNFEESTKNSRIKSQKYYNFKPIMGFSPINDNNYDYLFIVLASYNILETTQYYQENIKNIFNQIINIIENNNFKFVALFDNYDFDYDPNTFISNPKINLFFKRNYNKNKIYKENVVPFPFIMFGEKSLIEKCDTELVSKDEYFKNKNVRCFFTGCTTSDHYYEYNDADVVRNRKYFYDRIHSYLYNPGHIDYDRFIHELKNSKFAVDLLGAGDPNKRTFEILLSGSLMISQYNHLLWPFENDDKFSEELIFKNEHEFITILNNLAGNNDLYLKCLENQYNIVKKYFNKNWLKKYIINKIDIFL
jgi:hypothetical protein